MVADRCVRGGVKPQIGSLTSCPTPTGAVSEQLSDTDRALTAYENALRHNPASVSALTQVGGIARGKEDFAKVGYVRALGDRHD